MRLLTFSYPSAPDSAPRLGALAGEGATVIDLLAAEAWAESQRGLPAQKLPGSMYELIAAGPRAWQAVRGVINALEGVDILEARSPQGVKVGVPISHQLYPLPPLPRPMSIRDFYAFEDHVAAAHATRGKSVPPEWYEFPAFYFSNPNAIFGPGETVPYPRYSFALDYELEVAAIIGRPGMDIQPDQVEKYIFGYTIMNDWTARDVQQREARIGLGPAKAKDFATSLGPWVVTPDELADKAAGRPGVYNLQMFARINGQERSRGNWKDIHYSFGEMIARASQGVYLMPGDVIGSGTVGSGCLLELTENMGPWLQPGDRVELEIERLGVLENKVGGRD